MKPLVDSVKVDSASQLTVKLKDGKVRLEELHI